jgi:hypothetical protein
MDNGGSALGEWPRITVQWRNDKLICPNGDEITPPWWIKMINGRLYFVQGAVHGVAVLDNPTLFTDAQIGQHCYDSPWELHLCSCGVLFVSYYKVTWLCEDCLRRSKKAAAAVARRRARRASIKRSAERAALRLDLKCAACGEPVPDRQRSAGDRPSYCSNRCRQRSYRRRHAVI